MRTTYHVQSAQIPSINYAIVPIELKSFTDKNILYSKSSSLFPLTFKTILVPLTQFENRLLHFETEKS